jgi:hypothetical protein
VLIIITLLLFLITIIFLGELRLSEKEKNYQLLTETEVQRNDHIKMLLRGSKSEEDGLAKKSQQLAEGRKQLESLDYTRDNILRRLQKISSLMASLCSDYFTSSNKTLSNISKEEPTVRKDLRNSSSDLLAALKLEYGKMVSCTSVDRFSCPEQLSTRFLEDKLTNRFHHLQHLISKGGKQESHLGYSVRSPSLRKLLAPTLPPMEEDKEQNSEPESTTFTETIDATNDDAAATVEYAISVQESIQYVDDFEQVFITLQ